MTRTIIAAASEASREQMSRLLASSGYSVYRCCASESTLRRALTESEDSILVFIGLLPDCKPDDLIWDYGDRVQILWIAKPAVLEDCESRSIFRLALPTSGQTVIGALEMLLQLHRRNMPRRTGQDRELVERAKAILMKQMQLTEPEAHHLLQKQAMDRGVRMTEYAARIIQNSRSSTGPEDES